MAEVTLRKLVTLAEMLPHYGLVAQLSAHLTAADYETFLMQMIPHNYRQVAAFAGNDCVGLSGYWLATKLYSGPYLEIDNFVVDENHRNGRVGSQLLAWMEEEARNQGCNMLMLDTYVENFAAHRFYYRHGFVGRGIHYLKKL